MVTVNARHAEPTVTRKLTYEDYLHLSDLLDLQQPLSTDPDELHFIVVHQAMELWFRLLGHDLRRLVRMVDGDRLVDGSVVMRRVNDVLAALLVQMGSLRTLPATSFHRFRGHLDGASGFQSAQFRELEVVSGLRDDGYLGDLRDVCGGNLPPGVSRTLPERSVAQAHRDAGRRDGLTDWADLYAGAHTSTPLYLLSEQLLDYDELWVRWRTEHVSLVRRMIGGSTRGTGGTSIGYLERTLRHRFFPHLWEARGAVAVAPAPAADRGGPTSRCDRAGA